MRRLFVVSLLLACPTAGPDEPPQKPIAGPIAAKGDEPKKPTPAATPFTRDDEAAVRTALKEAGVEFGEHDCVAWPAGFPRVVVVGSFAHDRGCEMTGTFVDRRWQEGGDEVAGLGTRGFKEARLADKEAIARAWVDEVVHAFGGEFVTAPEPAFTLANVAFSPVVARENKIGGVVVEGWERVPSGMRDESRFVLMTYRFAPHGELEAETKRDFAVEGERLRAAEAAKAISPTRP